MAGQSIEQREGWVASAEMIIREFPDSDLNAECDVLVGLSLCECRKKTDSAEADDGQSHQSHGIPPVLCPPPADVGHRVQEGASGRPSGRTRVKLMRRGRNVVRWQAITLESCFW